MKCYLQPNYRVLPNLLEIREHEKARELQSPEGLIYWKPDSPHEIFESMAVVKFQGGKWQNCSIEDEFDGAEDFPVGYIDSVGYFCLGKSVKTNDRQHLNWDAWLGEEISYQNWPEILLAATKEFSADLAREQFLSSLIELNWSPSVDWETGIDEGGFEAGKEFFKILPDYY